MKAEAFEDKDQTIYGFWLTAHPITIHSLKGITHWNPKHVPTFIANTLFICGESLFRSSVFLNSAWK